MHLIVIVGLLFSLQVLAQPAGAAAGSPGGDLSDILRMLPQSEAFEKWAIGTGATAPDFDILPSQPFLPDPLRFIDGSTVQNRVQWEQRRVELLDLFKHYTLGSFPP